MTDAELLEAYRATHDRQVLESLFARHYPAGGGETITMVVPGQSLGIEVENALRR